MYESENIFEFNPEAAGFEAETFEFDQAEWGEIFSESELMDLTAELLDITTEAELDLFLGGLIKKVGGAIGKVVKSPIGQAVGGVLKGAAKKALPIAGGALGGYFGGPLGAKIGSGLASAAGSALGLELEALSQEDLEFEGGKQFVRFAADTVKNAVSAPSSVNPLSAAQKAAAKAAQKYAPNLLGPGSGVLMPTSGKGRRSGRWIRQGRNIIIENY
ncbi:hypothetical protein [Methylicorpusculum sp.]|uniref:hypothetical protein n=1 Tax=Methylicorpusculum sp. TaxID=2713644 RepID=UPI0027238BBB|nr:hypothetical protein [Methylicorpusculum sp.]MDO8844648.1 hypothetical protein [Methylicorpusculum sp.]MDO9238562.1 hypothetical protein [Methylicorpusculum sp.]MDP2178735.1 hypothetical protein [Methylicorpusculum sp.]MDZ4150292.1 hypothetical protein [Methylicorpusculum sp.]